MRKLAFLSLLCITVLFDSYGQNPIQQQCGFDQLLHTQQVNFPNFAKTYQSIYTQAKNAARANPNAITYRNDKIYTIPVVVHIVWRDATQNIPESVIQDQIDVLNEDFRRQNADADQIRSEFESIVADAKIEFDLVEILRVKTDTIFEINFDWNTLSYQYPDHVKQTRLGGSDPYDVKEFLNIWVCPIEMDQIFGYAYPPVGSQAWPDHELLPAANLDGVVINYKAFGRNLSFVTDIGDSLRIEGRTAVHEVGHYLGLKHPWGQLSATAHCTADDGLSDTPKIASSSFFDCDHDKNTCIEDTMDQMDMVENFMDFAKDACKNSFTKEQVKVMRYVLEYYRPNLNFEKIVINPGEKVMIYPNPTKGQIKILMDVDKNIRYDIKLKNLLGVEMPIKVFNTTISNKSNYRIDLSDFSAGVYVLEFRDLNNQMFSKKIILTK